MSPVRRRAPRPGRKWLIPALLLLALAALAVLWLALREKPIQLPDPAVARPVTLSDREAADIARIGIENRFDAPYALTQTPDGWRMEGDGEFIFRESTLNDIVNNAALIVAEDTVGDTAAHPEWQLFDFGLEQPAARVTVRFADGGEIAFRIGDGIPQETPAYYFLLEGDSHIYAISADVYEAYTYTRVGLHDVRDPALKGELIDRISFTGDDPFAAERRADGWYLTEPFVYPLADAAMDSLLEKLEGLRFAQYVGKAEQCDLPALGLSPARRTLTLGVAESVVTGYDENGQAYAQTRLPAYDLVFALGDYANDVVFYCLYRGEAVKATVFSCGFLLTQGYAPLLLAAPFNAPTNDLLSLAVDRDGAEAAYEIELRERVLPNNEVETDENGSVIYDVHVVRDGAPVDAEAFLTAYRELLSLRVSDRLPGGWQPEGAPVLTVAYTRSASSRVVALYPFDALHYALAIDGEALFRVEKDWGGGAVEMLLDVR